MVIIRQHPDTGDPPADTQYEKWVKKWEHENDDHLWLTGDFTEVIDCQRERVESFYCGFLGFYEQQSRTNKIDYDIFFKWKDDKHVEVYLFPAPLREKIVHQKDKKLYDELVIRVNRENKGGGGGNTKGDRNYAITPPPASSSLGTSDPPGTSSPPPPPPK